MHSVDGALNRRGVLQIDEYTRECLAIRAGRSIWSSDVIEMLAELMVAREMPEHIRSDNGPGTVQMDGKAAILPKIGRVGMVEALRSDGSIREAAINRTAGTWFACFCVEDGQRLPPAGPRPTVGVDVGVGTMATLAKALGDVYSSSGQCLEGAGVWLPVWAQSVASGGCPAWVPGRLGPPRLEGI